MDEAHADTGPRDPTGFLRRAKARLAGRPLPRAGGTHSIPVNSRGWLVRRRSRTQQLSRLDLGDRKHGRACKPRLGRPPV